MAWSLILSISSPHPSSRNFAKTLRQACKSTRTVIMRAYDVRVESVILQRFLLSQGVLLRAIMPLIEGLGHLQVT